jgi:D-alanyl-D-alanine carboxypeptidase
MQKQLAAIAAALVALVAIAAGCGHSTNPQPSSKHQAAALASSQRTAANPDPAENYLSPQVPKLGPPAAIGCGPNGQIRPSCLAPIYGGRLLIPAARAWNAMNARAPPACGLRLYPLGSMSSYRTYAQQVYLWNSPPHAHNTAWKAYPGTSNHGWGLAVDLATPAMRSCVDRIGARYGFSKRCSDAPIEWWHIRWSPVCNHSPPLPSPKPYCRRGVKVGRHCKAVLRRGSHGPGVRLLQRALRNEGWCSTPLSGRFDGRTESNLKRFQRKRAHVRPDGVVGRRTWRAIERYRGGRSRCTRR